MAGDGDGRKSGPGDLLEYLILLMIFFTQKI